MGRQADRLNHAMSLRLSELQYRHLVAQAALREIPLSEAAREALERDIEAQPELEGDVRCSYRTLLAGVDVDQVVGQLRERGLAT